MENAYLQLIFEKIIVSATVGVSLYLPVQLCGILSLGHGGFMAIGAYLFAALTTGVIPVSGFAASPTLAFAVIGLIVGLVMFAFGFALLKLSGDALSVVTMGIGEIIRIGLSNLSAMGGSGGYGGIPRFGSPLLMMGTLLISAGLCIWIRRSRVGLFCRAIAADEIAAATCGVNTRLIKSLVMAISCAIAAIGGCLYAGSVGFVSPSDFSFVRSCECLAIVILGGKHIFGVILAATGMELFSALLQGMAEWKMILYGLLLIIICVRNVAKNHPVLRQSRGINRIFQQKEMDG